MDPKLAITLETQSPSRTMDPIAQARGRMGLGIPKTITQADRRRRQRWAKGLAARRKKKKPQRRRRP